MQLRKKQMANESLASAAVKRSSLDTVSPAVLVDFIDEKLSADNAIENPDTGGLVRSLRYGRTISSSVAAIERYSPGADEPSAFDGRASLINDEPMARKYVGSDQPRHLRVLAEYNDRYFGSIGPAPLAGLARLSVAMSAVVAEKTGSQVRLSIAGDREKPFRQREEETTEPALITTRDYDKYAASPRAGVETLSRSLAQTLLDNLRGEESKDADAFIVVSDFLAGAKRDEKGKLTGFDWHAPLRNLHTEVGDRLFVVRLTSPAQTQLPYSPHYAVEGTSLSMNLPGYFAAAAEYQQRGEEKAQRIADCLAPMRSLELSTMDAAPILKLRDFLLEQPAAS
jgi:hypothetical protein